MKDFQARAKTLLTEAEDCDLIAELATDCRKRDLYKRLGADLRAELERLIARAPDGCVAAQLVLRSARHPIVAPNCLR